SWSWFFAHDDRFIPALLDRTENVNLIVTAIWLGIGAREHSTKDPQFMPVQGAAYYNLYFYKGPFPLIKIKHVHIMKPLCVFGSSIDINTSHCGIVGGSVSNSVLWLDTFNGNFWALPCPHF
ncbi:hypothetical protein EGW08_012869, partial [Elysia chlorotica]